MSPHSLSLKAKVFAQLSKASMNDMTARWLPG
jgi:hypothetical protein